MTQRSPYGNDKKVAISVTVETTRKRKVALIYGFFFILAIFLFSSSVLAQEDSEISEEEAASQAEVAEDETDFDFFGDANPMSVEQLRQMQEHFAELSEDVAGATVAIQVGQNQGTGVIVSRDGYIMTAAHVIGGAGRTAKIILPDTTEVYAETLGLNRTVDSGLLKIKGEGKKYPYLSLGVSEGLKNGQWVMAIGHPGGWEPERGLVFRVGRILNQGENAISTDCTLVGGDSGGPLVDMEGNVIGIHSRIGAQITDNIHVPVDIYSNQWDDLASSRDWGRGIGGTNPANEPWLGLSFETDEMVIQEVVEDGPADKAGIEVGDKLVEFGEERVPNQTRFRRIYLGSEPGDEVKIKIKRGDEELELVLTIGSRADR